MRPESPRFCLCSIDRIIGYPPTRELRDKAIKKEYLLSRVTISEGLKKIGISNKYSDFSVEEMERIMAQDFIEKNVENSFERGMI